MSNESDFNIDPSQLKQLGDLAVEAISLENEIEMLNGKLADAGKKLRDVTEIKMPEILMECGLSEIKTLDGKKLTLTKFYSASIPDENAAGAFKWLRDHNHDAIIKSRVEASFGKGEDDRVTELMRILQEYGFTEFNVKTGVHAMTLKSFVKEQMEAGNELPQDLFKVFVGNKVKIK